MATLHLTIKKKWFDMILSGEKKEEYREVKDHWIRRFCDRKTLSLTVFQYHLKMNWESIFRWHHWDDIIFRNGYSKDSPTMRVRIENVRISEGQTNWGAEPNQLYFVFELGEILEVQNVEGY